MKHTVFRTTFWTTKCRLWGVFGGAFFHPKTDQNDIRNDMENEAPKKVDLGPGGGGADDAGTSRSTLAPVVKRTFPKKTAILRGRGTQMAQASVYEPLKDRL